MISIRIYDFKFQIYDLGYGVIARATPGMAAEDAFDAEPAAFERSVFEYGFHHVLAARRCVATRRRGERRDEEPVKINRNQKQLASNYFPLIFFRALHMAFSITS